MKETEEKQIKFIGMSAFLNSIIILILLLLHLLNLKLNYNIITAILLFLLALNLVLLLSKAKFSRLLRSMGDRLEILEGISEASPTAIFVHRKLKFIYANKKAAELFNVEKPSDIIGKSVDSFVKLNKEVIGDERIESALGEKSFEPLVEEMFINKNGETVDLEVYSTPLKIKQSIGVLVLCRDITEKKMILELEKRVEAEERKLREKIEHDKLKEEFFANISHELRTPLTIILGTLQLIEKDSNAYELTKVNNYNVLKQNSYRLLKLVNNLLDITKIDSGYYNLTIQSHNIVSVVEEVTQSVAGYIKSKGLVIEFDTEIEEKIVECDLDSIERVVLNILSNALKFTSKGGGIFVNIIDKVDKVKIIIKDTGIGIKKEDLNLIFDRFRQVDKSFTRNHEGSGLGLAIVKSLVEMNSGNITVKSEYNAGTEFIITFPAKDAVSKDELEENIGEDLFLSEKIKMEFSDI